MEDTIKLPTLGEQRIRITVNQSGLSFVDEIKQKSAQLIDFVNQGIACNPSFNREQYEEWLRLKEFALKAYEEATMWAVKAATI